MVDHQLRDRGITNPRILAAMLKVRRELFVSPDFASSAYEDRPLPIGHDQTISQPYIVGIMTDLLNPGPSDKVLEVGTGSGYQAAILAELAQKVYTIELIKPLAEEAMQRLAALDYDNVSIKTGDGYSGWPEVAPFDEIIVTAASPTVPAPLVEQLKPGGRMVIPVGDPDKIQDLILVEKAATGNVTKKSIMPVRFVPFKRAK